MKTVGFLHRTTCRKPRAGFYREQDFKTTFHFPCAQKDLHPLNMRIIRVLMNLPRLALYTMILSGALLIFHVVDCPPVYGMQSNSASTEEVQGTKFVNIDEEKAYRAAKKEPNPRTRAKKLFEFYLKYPESILMRDTDYEEIKVIENAHNDYYAASREPDLEKRATLLIEFSRKYPDTDQTGNIDDDYMRILSELRQEGKYELLMSLSEKWIEIHPESRTAHAFIAEAAMNLHQFDKCGKSLESIHEMAPSPGLAREIHDCYQKTENLGKRIEWADILFKLPEFDDDYMLRYDCVIKFYEDMNLPEAAKYAKLALESADLAEQRDASKHGKLQKVRQVCNHIIASDCMEKDNYAAAIDFFKEAIQAERYELGYYKIGICLDNQKEAEEAMLYYAMAELMNGENASKAKSRLEIIYKALHNQTLVGIEKIYKKAKESLEQPVEESIQRIPHDKSS